MKRTLFLTLFLILAFILCACSAGDTVPATVSPSEAATTPAPSEAPDGASSVSGEDPWPELSGQTLHIYCGAGMKEPFQKIADRFSELTGCEVNVTFANAAQIQTQISTAQEGAFFIAGAAGEVTPVEDFVSSSVKLVKHIPVLAVAAGNPKGISGIKDLGTEGIITVIGDAESTPIGKIAMKAFNDLGVADTVSLAATTTTAPQLATVISLGQADAAIIWKENCNVEGVEICSTSDLDAYIQVIPAARLVFSEGDAAADAFSEFLASGEATGIWMEHGYELAQ